MFYFLIYVLLEFLSDVVCAWKGEVSLYLKAVLSYLLLTTIHWRPLLAEWLWTWTKNCCMLWWKWNQIYNLNIIDSIKKKTNLQVKCICIYKIFAYRGLYSIFIWVYVSIASNIMNISSICGIDCILQPSSQHLQTSCLYVLVCMKKKNSPLF